MKSNLDELIIFKTPIESVLEVKLNYGRFPDALTILFPKGTKCMHVGNYKGCALVRFEKDKPNPRGFRYMDPDDLTPVIKNYDN